MNTLPERPSNSEDIARIKTSIFHTISVDDRRRTKKHRVAALAGAGLIVLGTTAGAFAVASAPQGQVNYTADCYASADLGSKHGTSLYLPGDQKGTAATAIDKRVQLAEDMCASTWRIGTFQNDTVAPGATFTVPALVACQLPDERLGVFPSNRTAEQLCATLGLPTPHE